MEQSLSDEEQDNSPGLCRMKYIESCMGKAFASPEVIRDEILTLETQNYEGSNYPPSFTYHPRDATCGSIVCNCNNAMNRFSCLVRVGLKMKDDKYYITPNSMKTFGRIHTGKMSTSYSGPSASLIKKRKVAQGSSTQKGEGLCNETLHVITSQAGGRHDDPRTIMIRGLSMLSEKAIVISGPSGIVVDSSNLVSEGPIYIGAPDGVDAVDSVVLSTQGISMRSRNFNFRNVQFSTDCPLVIGGSDSDESSKIRGSFCVISNDSNCPSKYSMTLEVGKESVTLHVRYHQSRSLKMMLFNSIFDSCNVACSEASLAFKLEDNMRARCFRVPFEGSQRLQKSFPRVSVDSMTIRISNISSDIMREITENPSDDFVILF